MLLNYLLIIFLKINFFPCVFSVMSLVLPNTSCFCWKYILFLGSKSILFFGIYCWRNDSIDQRTGKVWFSFFSTETTNRFFSSGIVVCKSSLRYLIASSFCYSLDIGRLSFSLRLGRFFSFAFSDVSKSKAYSLCKKRNKDVPSMVSLVDKRFFFRRGRESEWIVSCLKLTSRFSKKKVLSKLHRQALSSKIGM